MALINKKIKVVYFQRKQRKLGNFSIETYFEQVRKNLSNNQFNPVLKIVPFESNGIVRRILNTIFCFFNQGDINHITGDIHYVSLLLSKKKTVLTILDCGILHDTKGLKRKIIKYFWFTLPIYKSSVITCISESTKQDLLINMNFQINKIKVIYVAISPNFSKHSKEFNYHCPQILQIGTAENKNLKNLIPSLSGINCKLVIVGKINDYILQLLTNYNINFLNISNKLTEIEIINLYQISDIITLVSTLEGFGMPIIEANTIGRVVIAGNNSSMIEVSDNAACLVDAQNIEDIRNGFNKIINNIQYRNDLIHNGYSNAKRFGIDKISHDYAEIYKSIYFNVK